ncbi:MAG: transporter associated domain-containing protein, partial [Micrococcales bacterium]
YDREVPEVEQISESSSLVNARYSLFDLGELFDLELEDEDVDTVGGLLAKELGRLPKQGEFVQVSGLILTADRIEPRRKRLVTVVVQQTQALAGAEAALEENNEL